MMAMGVKFSTRLSVFWHMGIRSPELKVSRVWSAWSPALVVATVRRPTSPLPSVLLSTTKVWPLAQSLTVMMSVILRLKMSLPPPGLEVQYQVMVSEGVKVPSSLVESSPQAVSRVSIIARASSRAKYFFM